MTEVSARYATLADRFAATIDAVPADKWHAPSPCEEWTALDVVRHVCTTPGIFFSLIGREIGDLPSVDAAPAQAFAATSAAVQAALETPEVADAEFDGMTGRSTFAQSIDRFICADLIVHRWDLARAVGGDDRLQFDEVQSLEALQAAASQFGDAMRGPQAFGPELEPPPDADDQTRMLAFLGRRA